MVIKAEGDAESANLIREAVEKAGPGVVAIRNIEAAKHIVENVAGNPNINFIQGGNTMNMLHLNKGL